MSTDRSERRAGTPNGSVALFIDWDNFAIGLRQEMPDRPADVGPILRWARRFGVLTVCRAYGEWRDPQERLAIYNAGVEVVYAPVLPLGGSVVARSGVGGAKSLADTAMAVDVTEALSLMPIITSVILATSDKDLIPVLRFAQRRGLHAVVVGSDRTAGALRDLADEFISYRQLLEQEVPSGTQSRPAMVPPVRYPRAPRTAALPAPASDSPRRGRFDSRAPRSVVTPVAAPPLAPSTSIGEPNPAAPEVSTPGSVFADGEETAGEAAARRRRRGGRRRRGREVTGGPEALADGAEPDEPQDEETDSGTPAEAAGAAVQVPAGDLAAEGPTAVEAAATESAPEPARRSPIVASPAPSGARGPVVLPGERLRRLASAAPEPAAPVAEPEDASPPGDEDAVSEEPAPRASRSRRVGRGRAAKSAAKTDPSPADDAGDEASPSTAASDGDEPESPAGAEDEEGETSPATKGSRPARGRRRGGRSR
ncbi:MAG TPA: NYN domain-containing protein [Chloroflexota bacterium]|nr:NYN domain-containing protein [Chloroflexota bacterium]